MLRKKDLKCSKFQAGPQKTYRTVVVVVAALVAVAVLVVVIVVIFMDSLPTNHNVLERGWRKLFNHSFLIFQATIIRLPHPQKFRLSEQSLHNKAPCQRQGRTAICASVHDTNDNSVFDLHQF